MAELLIYNTDHWMDKMPEADFQRLSKDTDWLKKYLARNRRGDVIEVRPDGYWTGPKAKGFDWNTFRVISIPGVDFSLVAHLGSRCANYQRRYRLDLPAGDRITIVTTIADLRIMDKGV